jgi:hypothetical protein
MMTLVMLMTLKIAHPQGGGDQPDDKSIHW